MVKREWCLCLARRSGSSVTSMEIMSLGDVPAYGKRLQILAILPTEDDCVRARQELGDTFLVQQWGCWFFLDLDLRTNSFKVVGEERVAKILTEVSERHDPDRR